MGIHGVMYFKQLREITIAAKKAGVLCAISRNHMGCHDNLFVFFLKCLCITEHQP